MDRIELVSRLRKYAVAFDISIGPDVAKDIDQAADLLSTSSGDTWRDIASAPKDGTVVLAYFPLIGLHDSWCRVVPVYWASCDEWIFASRAASGFSKTYQPTHWQPLPSPPSPGESLCVTEEERQEEQGVPAAPSGSHATHGAAEASPPSVSIPNAEERAFRLWALLDDIDTLDDACRADDEQFRVLTRNLQQKRFAIMSGEQWETLALKGYLNG